jgi:hypothetical protein
MFNDEIGDALEFDTPEYCHFIKKHGISDIKDCEIAVDGIMNLGFSSAI